MPEEKQNQIKREYEDVNGFELRTGKFYNPNEFLQGEKFEIRILHKDPEMIEVLHDKLIEILKSEPEKVGDKIES